MDIKFLDGSDFFISESEPNFGFLHTLDNTDSKYNLNRNVQVYQLIYIRDKNTKLNSP